MGLPSIDISFRTAAAAAVARSQKGIVGLILKDAAATLSGKAIRMTNTTEVPTELSEVNRSYIKRAFTGYVNPPREVVAFIEKTDAAEFTASLAYFATVEVDYLCGPVDCTQDEAVEIAAWVKSRRAESYTVKAVLPTTSQDNEGLVNFAAEGIKCGDDSYTTAQFCSRVAGLLAGTPMTISSTFAPLPEVTDIKRLTKVEMDTAIDAGKLMLYHDGEKVKVARGVNSLTTTTQDKGDSFKKIKVVETVDMIRHDVQKTCQDSYIGKYANSYDNKCLLISAIKGYFETLELAGILDKGKSVAEIDIAAQAAYLSSTGVDVSKMSEQQIKEANTGDRVFISCSIKILDAIEDIVIGVTL